MPDAIQMLQRRFGYFPKTFTWNGQTVHVEHVLRCWTQTGNRLHGSRLVFRVQCASGTFDLTQDVQADTWTLQPTRERS